MTDATNPLPPSVGVAVVVWRNGKLLLGEDLTKGDKVVFGVPGGHWESGETLTEAVRRETLEETGLQIQNIRLVSVYDFFRKDKNKSYVTIGFSADYSSGEARDESATTRRRWDWFDPAKMPSSLFPPDRILIERCASGVIYEPDDSTTISAR